MYLHLQQAERQPRQGVVRPATHPVSMTGAQWEGPKNDVEEWFMVMHPRLRESPYIYIHNIYIYIYIYIQLHICILK